MEPSAWIHADSTALFAGTASLDVLSVDAATAAEELTDAAEGGSPEVSCRL